MCPNYTRRDRINKITTNQKCVGGAYLKGALHSQRNRYVYNLIHKYEPF